MSNDLSKYRHLIWDWNGTLLNDVGECLTVLNRMLKKRHLPPQTREQYRNSFGFPVIEYYRQIGFDFESESFDAVAREYHAGYDKHLTACRLQRGARQILRAAARAGFTQSLLSAYHQEGLEKAVDYFRIRRWFIKVVGLNDYYAHSKMENAKRWVAEMDYDPHRIIFIGDTLHDYEVARAMGVQCLLLSCGHQARPRLQSCTGRLFHSLQELQNTLISQGASVPGGGPVGR